MEKWVDYSKFQRRQTAANVARMAADAVVGAYVGSWHGIDLGANPYAEDNLRLHRDMGQHIGTYIVVDRMNGSESVRRGLVQCGSVWPHLDFVALDIEVPSVTEKSVWQAYEAVRSLKQFPVGYTGNWFMDFWAVQRGHWPNLPPMPWIVASYTGRPANPLSRIAVRRDGSIRPYSGPILGHQYQGSTAAYGTTVDFNSVDDSLIPRSKGPIEEVIMGTIRDAFARAGELVEAAIEEAKALPIPTPPATPVPPPPASVREYTVVAGDTASGIAVRHGLSFEEFSALNAAHGRAPQSGNWNLIYPGERFLVPA